MRWPAWWPFLLAALVNAKGASPKPGLKNNASTVLPSQDPFYDVPVDVDALDQGTILKHRKPPSPLAAFRWQPDNLQETHQILYRTTDSYDRATATVLTVMVPKNANFSRLVSFQVAEDAATIDCAPSYGFQLAAELDPKLNSPTTQVQLLLIEGALARGWPVVTADVGGPKGVWGANKLAGQAILDGIRAALDSGSFTNITKNASVAMWGYSGGSIVTQAAVELKHGYAPELDIAGAAIGGVGATDPSSLLAINNSPDAGLLATALLGLSNEYPELRKLIDSHLKPQCRELFYKPLHQCVDANIDDFKNKNVLGMFDDLPSVLTDPAVMEIFKQNQVDSIAGIPFFWYQNVRDRLAPIKDIDAQVRQYCADGATIEYRRNDAPHVTHENYGLIGTPAALSWLEGVLNGATPERGCSEKTVHKQEIDPSFLNLFPRYLQASLLRFGADKLG